MQLTFYSYLLSYFDLFKQTTFPSFNAFVKQKLLRMIDFGRSRVISVYEVSQPLKRFFSPKDCIGGKIYF